MAANLDQLPADSSQRLVIRMQKSMAITSIAAIGTIFLFGAWVLLLMGTVSAALFCPGIGGVFLYAMLGGYLCIDSVRSQGRPHRL